LEVQGAHNPMNLNCPERKSHTQQFSHCCQ